MTIETDLHADETAPPATPKRRRWASMSVALALLLALALTPPFLNVNRLQRRIAASLSLSLGRPVHLDRVTMHLLPVPGFTLENLVVSEDPAFGDEPVIRANTVEVTLRPSSLWRRQVELSTIRFIEPSLNLVRNAQGRWNLQSLLMHAASVNTAPTAQTTVGPAPRFPYIEATDGRVNVKLGAEKQPFSLTEADFALWLPTPAGWRVRLEAKPARTDENISDPGLVKLEGSLQRAPTMADVPVNLTASWQGAPLGEASRLLSGDDANWRGKLNVDATLAGTLGAARLTTKVHLDDLRRADFVPAKTLELTVDCTGMADVTTATVAAPACQLSSPQTGNMPGPLVSATAERIDLSQPSDTVGLSVGTTGVSEHWILDWARLFSQRIPPHPDGTGNLVGRFTLVPAAGAGAAFWRGALRGDVGPLTGEHAPTHPAASGPAPPPQHSQPGLLITADATGATLEPLDLMPTGTEVPLLLSAHANNEGLMLHLAGSASPNTLRGLLASAPPLGDGLRAALPEIATSSDKPVRLDLTCERTWHGAQTCAQAVAEPVKVKKRRRR